MQFREFALGLLKLSDERVHAGWMLGQVKRELLEEGFSIDHKNFDTSVKSTSISDFEFLKPISKGAFGRVFLGRKKATNDVYAIKVLNCKDALTDRQRQNILVEVFILFYILF